MGGKKAKPKFTIHVSTDHLDLAVQSVRGQHSGVSPGTCVVANIWIEERMQRNKR